MRALLPSAAHAALGSPLPAGAGHTLPRGLPSGSLCEYPWEGPLFLAGWGGG